MEVVKLFFDYHFEVVNYVSTTFQLQPNFSYKFTFSFTDPVWLPHSSFLLSQWFSYTQNYANTI